MPLCTKNPHNLHEIKVWRFIFQTCFTIAQNAVEVIDKIYLSEKELKLSPISLQNLCWIRTYHICSLKIKPFYRRLESLFCFFFSFFLLIFISYFSSLLKLQQQLRRGVCPPWWQDHCAHRGPFQQMHVPLHNKSKYWINDGLPCKIYQTRASNKHLQTCAQVS